MKKVGILYSVLEFCLLVLFFVVLHPIAIFDTDDWAFIYHLRLPIPVPGAWNPIKVFPEVSMSFWSYIGAYILYPLTGRYCFSLSVTNGIFICLILTLYFEQFRLLAQKKYDFTVLQSIFSSAIFIGMHFWILVTNEKNNIFMFYAYDMTCIYHYTLSTILNASLVMHMIRVGGYGQVSALSKKHNILIIIWTYLAIFSSLYTNVVLAAYVGVELLLALIDDLKKKSFKLSEYVKENKIRLIVIAVWACSLMIETTGGRSEGKTDSFIVSLKYAFSNIFGWIGRFNLGFIIFAVAAILIWVILVEDKRRANIFKYIFAFVLTVIYIVLLSSVVNSSYTERIDVMLAVNFWLMLILVFLLIEAMNFYKNGIRVLAVLSALSIIVTAYVSNTYKEINYVNIPYEQCEALVDNIIEQFKTAEKNGDTEIDLKVPAFDTEDNWPFGTYSASHFTKTMYRHRIIKTRINVNNIVTSEEMTQMYVEKRN